MHVGRSPRGKGRRTGKFCVCIFMTRRKYKIKKLLHKTRVGGKRGRDRVGAIWTVVVRKVEMREKDGDSRTRENLK